MTANFLPNLWAPALLEQLKSSLVFRTGEPFIGPQPKPVLYRPVDEGSYLSAVLSDELDAHVPYAEAGEAAQVMIDALNAWIERKVAA
jgi:hypothetical protein